MKNDAVNKPLLLFWAFLNFFLEKSIFFSFDSNLYFMFRFYIGSFQFN